MQFEPSSFGLGIAYTAAAFALVAVVREQRAARRRASAELVRRRAEREASAEAEASMDLTSPFCTHPRHVRPDGSLAPCSWCTAELTTPVFRQAKPAAVDTLRFNAHRGLERRHFMARNAPAAITSEDATTAGRIPTTGTDAQK